MLNFPELPEDEKVKMEDQPPPIPALPSHTTHAPPPPLPALPPRSFDSPPLPSPPSPPPFSATPSLSPPSPPPASSSTSLSPPTQPPPSGSPPPPPSPPSSPSPSPPTLPASPVPPSTLPSSPEESVSPLPVRYDSRASSTLSLPSTLSSTGSPVSFGSQTPRLSASGPLPSAQSPKSPRTSRRRIQARRRTSLWLSNDQGHILTCDPRHLRVCCPTSTTSNGVKLEPLSDDLIASLLTFRVHGVARRGSTDKIYFKWIGRKLFCASPFFRMARQIVYSPPVGEKRPPPDQPTDPHWLRAHEQCIATRVVQTSLSRAPADIIATSRAFMAKYKRGKQHPWDATSEFLKHAITLWQLSEMSASDPTTVVKADTKIYTYMDKASMILSGKPKDDWTEDEIRDAKKKANKRLTCCRLKGKPLHVILLGAAASGKTFSQKILLEQLLPEALEEAVIVTTLPYAGESDTSQPIKGYPDWTDYMFPEDYAAATGLKGVDGNAHHLRRFLEHKFGKLGLVRPEDVDIDFPTQGVMVRDTTIDTTYHVCLTPLVTRNDEAASGAKKPKKNKNSTDFNHGLRIANPVFFVSIDGEIVREIEGEVVEEDGTKSQHGASSKFKKNLRVALQMLGFNTLEPSVHPDLLASSVKRHVEAEKIRNDMLSSSRGTREGFPPSVFKIVVVYANFAHVQTAAAQRAMKNGKSPPAFPLFSWLKGVKVEPALSCRFSKDFGFNRIGLDGPESDYFDSESEFVIIDNQFGYMRRNALYCSLPPQVKAQLTVHQVKGMAQFAFEDTLGTEERKQTASGLLFPHEMATARDAYKQLWAHELMGSPAVPQSPADIWGSDNVITTPISQQGVLYKTSVGTWKARYFVLQGNTLSYYTSKDEFLTSRDSAKRRIRLGACSVVSEVPKGKKLPSFQVPSHQNTCLTIYNLPKGNESKYHDSYTFCANNDEDRKAWVSALAAAAQDSHVADKNTSSPGCETATATTAPTSVSASVIGRWKRNSDAIADQRTEVKRASGGDWSGFGEERDMTITLTGTQLVANATSRNAELRLEDGLVLQVWAKEQTITLWVSKKRHLVAMMPAKRTSSRLALSLRFNKVDVVRKWSSLLCQTVEQSCVYAPKPGRAGRLVKASFKSGWGVVRPASISFDESILTIIWTDVERTLRVDIRGSAFSVRVGERGITVWVKKNKVLQKKPASLSLKRSTIGLQLLLADKDDLTSFSENLIQATLTS